ncbi:TetR/AcrR family transcriptional regulator [Nonomuraea sp. NPDC049480]|uniref:TetR/AcrR family transcriptional regulator n=1 Tax=Nonomuraea sp. NPDC049480 TaxID=3364353 RepID=UPI0037A43D23
MAPSVRNRKAPGVRREEILQTATEMFGDSGYRGVSIADIAAKVGISQPGLLHHFKSKEELLIAALERRDADSSAHMDEMFHKLSIADALVSLCRHNVEDPTAMRLYAVESAESIEPGHPAREFFLRRYARVRDRVADRIRRDQELHRLPATLDPLVLATEMIAVMDGLQIQWLLDPAMDLPGHMAAYLERLVIKEDR